MDLADWDRLGIERDNIEQHWIIGVRRSDLGICKWEQEEVITKATYQLDPLDDTCLAYRYHDDLPRDP